MAQPEITATPSRELTWMEAFSDDRERVEILGRDLGIHALAVEDCINSNQRSKFEDFGDHQLLVWFLYLQGEVYELEFVVFPRIILLVSNSPAPHGQSWRDYLGVSVQHKDAWHMLHQALRRAMDLSDGNVTPLFDSINEFEENLLSHSGELTHLLRLKRQLARAEFALSTLSSVVAQWQRFLDPKDDLAWRLRDLWDHCERVHQALVFHRTQVAGSMEMYWGMTARRTNDQIKKLTILACLFAPLTFWTSFWGMNFTTIPFHSAALFVISIVSMPVSAVLTYAILRKKGYL